ncbi:mast cell protease 1A [Aulostomus maculatus]
MYFPCTLVIVILALTLNEQVYSGKIHGGQESAKHSRPYMVLLELRISNGDVNHCGGFLLNERFVMTAAHCQAENYTVFLGLHNVLHKKNIRNISVEQSFPHECYNRTGLQNDIMLLKLSSNVNFSNNVQPVNLAAEGDISAPLSTVCTVCGWGETDTFPYSFTLMEANVVITLNQHCAMEKSYCSVGDTGPAQGDSGGPLICKDGKAYGLVSATYEPFPGGAKIHHYTKIPYYRGWIDSIINQHQKLL